MTAARTVPAEASSPIAPATDTRKTFSPPPPPPEGSGIAFSLNEWSGWRYDGTRDALVAAGIVPQGEFFPGDRPGRQRCLFKRPDGRTASISKFVPAGTFKVTVRFNAEDEVHLRAHRARRDALAEAQRTQGMTEQLLRGAPKSHEDFRKQAAQRFWNAWGGAKLVIHQEFGFSYTAEAEKEIKAMASLVYHSMLQAATTFDPVARDKPLVDAWMKSARLDVTLQDMLKRATASQDLAQDAEDA